MANMTAKMEKMMTLVRKAVMMVLIFSGTVTQRHRSRVINEVMKLVTLSEKTKHNKTITFIRQLVQNYKSK